MNIIGMIFGGLCGVVLAGLSSSLAVAAVFGWNGNAPNWIVAPVLIWGIALGYFCSRWGSRHVRL